VQTNSPSATSLKGGQSIGTYRFGHILVFAGQHFLTGSKLKKNMDNIDTGLLKGTSHMIRSAWKVWTTWPSLGHETLVSKFSSIILEF
jgi:hypothetical protein